MRTASDIFIILGQYICKDGNKQISVKILTSVSYKFKREREKEREREGGRGIERKRERKREREREREREGGREVGERKTDK